MQLSSMNKGSRGRILSIGSEAVAFSLMALGVMPGDEFLLTDRAPLGGPLALEVNKGKIALRRDDAQGIEVEVIE